LQVVEMSTIPAKGGRTATSEVLPGRQTTTTTGKQSTNRELIGRQAGSVAGFHYTADHKKLSVTWDAATLEKYLANPRTMVPDTSMVDAGLKHDAKRA
jgi:cytochrome c2